MQQENGKVILTVDEYKKLLYSQRKLEALEAGGVDNWECYDDSLADFYAEENKE